MTIVEVFADILCPFTHVGLHRLLQPPRAGEAFFMLRVRAWPLELVNGGVPLDADMVAAKVDALRATVATDLFRGCDPKHFPTSSLAALSLAGAANKKALATGERASMMLRDAVFEHGVDIDDPRTLRRMADRLHVFVPFGAEQDVIDDWHEGQARGVLG